MGDTPPPPPRPFSPSPTKPIQKPSSETPTKALPQSTKPGDNKQPEKPKFGARAYAINGEARRKRKTLIGALVTSWDEAKVAAVPWGFCVSLNRMNENLELTQETLTFGRNKECTVTFTSPVISGVHCQLRKEQDSSGRIRVFLKDLSTNGTWHNRRKVGKNEEVKIKTGEEFWLVPSDNTLAKVGYVFYLKDEQKSARESSEALKAPQGQVTFVFTDVQSSTNLWEMDSTAMDRSLAMHDHIFRFLISKFNGFEVKTEGDAFMVTFYRIIDAVKWCLAVQSALNNHAWPKKLTELHPACQEKSTSGKLIFNGLRVRMGIHTGKPFCRINPVTNRMDYFGPIVNCSARVSDSAHGGQIVCSQEVVDAIKIEKEKEIESKSSPSPPSPSKMTASMKASSSSPEPEDTGKKISLDDFRKMKLDMLEGGLVEREEQKFTVKDEEVKILEITTKYLETMSLKGISEPVQIYEVGFPPLADRKFPPLRSKGGEESKKKKEEDTSDRDSKHSVRSVAPPARLRISRPPSPAASIAPTEFQDGDDLDEGGGGDTDDEHDADDLERLRVVRRDTIEKISRRNTGEPRKSVLAPTEPGSATKFLQVSIPSPRETSPSQSSTFGGPTSPPNRRAPPRPVGAPSTPSPQKKPEPSPHKHQSPQKPPPSRPPPPAHASPSRPPSQPSPQNISRTVSISPERPAAPAKVAPPSRVAPLRPQAPARPAPRTRT